MKSVSRKLVLALSFVGALSLLSPSLAEATGNRDNHSKHDKNKKNDKGKNDKGKKHIPEFDGRSTGAGVALLLGGVLVIVERKRRAARKAANPPA